MGNMFSGGGGQELYLSNGATAVFVETMMLAVSELAAREWEYGFAAVLARQDQSVFGLGVVGFGLAELDWGAGAAEQAANREFVLRVVELAMARHRWGELGYEPPFALADLREFHRMVEAFDPGSAAPGPAPQDVDDLRCPRHRVLAPLAYVDGCVFCTRGY